MFDDGMALFVESVQCNILSVKTRTIKKKLVYIILFKQSITAPVYAR